MTGRHSGRDTAETLARRIQVLIREDALAAGSHLPETALAERLRVSRTPVRGALLLLQQQGIVTRQPNRGFFVLDPTRLSLPASEALPASSSMPALCFDIGADYLKGALARHNTASDLAVRYAVSRGVIQQALQAMASEGWISRQLGYGWTFNDFLTSADTYEQCFRFRLLIEPAALRDPGYRVDRKRFAALRESLASGMAEADTALSERQMYRNGTLFHESIVACAGNPFLLESLQRANRLRRLIEYHIYARRESPKVEYQEHLAILDLLEAGDNEAAAALLTRHLERARRDKTAIAKALFAP